MSVNTYRHPASLLDAAPGVEAGGLLTLAVSVSHNMPFSACPQHHHQVRLHITYIWTALVVTGVTNRLTVRIIQLNY